MTPFENVQSDIVLQTQLTRSTDSYTGKSDVILGESPIHSSSGATQ
jgi:hypothetical protein